MPDHTPIAISLHRKSRVLRIRFENGRRYEYPFEYLRVQSRAADHRTRREPVVGKEQVNIVRIEPEGGYGLRVVFDDDHDTGSFAFETLYALGVNREENWARYLQRLQEIGYQRRETDDGDITVTALPFAWLARLLDRDEEPLKLTDGGHTVADALALLRRKPGRWKELLRDDDLEIAVNERPATLYTKLEHGDEFTIIPKSGQAPSSG